MPSPCAVVHLVLLGWSVAPAQAMHFRGQHLQEVLRADSLQPQGSKETKVIFINSIQDTLPYGHRLHSTRAVPKCPVSCTLTKQPDAFGTADAIVWNPFEMQTDMCHEFEAPVLEVPAVKPPGQRWAFSFFMEPPTTERGFRHGEHATKLLSGRVDYTMTYLHTSDIPWPVDRVTPLPSSAATRKQPAQDFARGRQHLLLWVSNRGCGNETYRGAFLQNLTRLLPPGSVQVYGKCDKQMPCPEGSLDHHSFMDSEGDACHQEFWSKFKFYAAFENMRCDGYITEKFFRGLRRGMVPLALGGMGRGDYERVAPADSFVHVDDFGTTEALAKRLLEIDRNDAEYNKFFAWRQNFQVTEPREVTDGVYCTLCQKLHSGGPVTQQHQDLVSWFYGKGVCHERLPGYEEGSAHNADTCTRAAAGRAAAGPLALLLVLLRCY